MSALPADREFLSGHRGDPGRFARARDIVLDARLGLARAGALLDELAESAPPRAVLVIGPYRPGSRDLARSVEELRRTTRHSVRVALGARAPEPDPALADGTVVSGLEGGGKYENLNRVLEATGADADWTLAVDDDVLLPRRFLDRFVGVCEHLGLALAQPAQSLASFAAWPQTRRRGGSLARETRFVEIGPVTAFRRDVLAAITPFPVGRQSWGLDLHWAALAEERGWRLGVVDALPVRHEHGAVAADYSASDEIEHARRFLAERPFVDSTRAQETIRTHPLR
ncbi:MAG: hypothetical protein QOH38_546 [Thermoleophilaceae bacterium]|nr:hypothetical protein [Thermoleophilaceae bacterium]